MSTLILYNIPSKIDTWSGSIRKLKHLFDANDIEYEQVWVPFNKITETLKARGVPPRPQAPFYTLPAITIQTPGEKDLTISDSYDIVDYFIKNEQDLIKKGILKKPLVAYNDKVDREFTESLELHLRQVEPLHELVQKIVLPYEINFLSDEDQAAFAESRFLKGIDVHARQKEPKSEKTWDDAVKFLNEDFKEWKGRKLFTGDYIVGDEFTWADVIYFIKFDHYNEIANADPVQSKVPKDGLIGNRKIKDWYSRVFAIVYKSKK